MSVPITLLLIARARAALTALTMAFVVTPVLAQQEGMFTIPRFSFEGGGSIDNMKVSYVTFGKRAEGDANVIVLVPPTSGLKGWAANHVGPGRTFDTNQYFVVSIDAIGGGGSSQPRDSLGTKFPQYNIRDMVRAQHAMLSEGLGIRRVLAIGGASSGAYQALEWGILFPGYSRGLILYVGAARADMHVKLIVDGIVATLSLDPAFASGAAVPAGGDAVRRASTVYFPWLLSGQALDAMGNDEALAKAEANFADGWARNWDAVGLAWRYRSSRLHDVSAPFRGDMAMALGKVTSAVLALPVSTDRTHPIALNEAMVKGLVNAKVTTAVLESDRGHVAVFMGPGTPEHEFVGTATRSFLKTLK